MEKRDAALPSATENSGQTRAPSQSAREQRQSRANDRSKAGGKGGDGWQAEKSALTRRAIIEAAIACFVDRGYTRTTTALIAAEAGVSRGAMMHHFPSRFAVLQAVVDHLHETRLAEYRELMANIDTPDQPIDYYSVKRSVEAAWKYVNLPSFVAYQELLSASRTDAELGAVIGQVERAFEREFLRTAKTVFPHWQNVGDLEAAHDLVHFVMQGMANSHMSSSRSKRAKRVMDLVIDQLLTIYGIDKPADAK
jgi:AcrR family transcriptional regulator